MINKALSLGRRAHAITDHGSISGHVLFEKAVSGLKQERGEGFISKGKKTYGEALDIKPIYGMEAYATTDVTGTGREFQKKFHISLLAKNLTGYANLLRLVTRSFEEGFYYRQSIDGPMLMDQSEGLIVLSGCETSSFMKKIEAQDWDGARALARNYRSAFGDDFYVEIQHFPHVSKKALWAWRIAEELGLKTVLTCDSHYLEPDGWRYQQFLWSIRDGKPVEPDGFRIEYAYLWEPDELFSFVSENSPEINWARVFENTVEVAEKVEAFRLPRAPHITYPMEGDKLAHIYWTCKRRLESLGKWTPEYQSRLQLEMGLIRDKEFVDYFLVVADMINWAKAQGIFVGPARGSSAGSVTCYGLRITEVDPLEYGLMFERFIDVTRTDLPDIDCFPTGTLVDTAEGQKPIEMVLPGHDFVQTRDGWRPVEALHTRSVDEALYKVSLDDGSSFTATANHRIIRNQAGAGIDAEIVSRLAIGDALTRIGAPRLAGENLSSLSGAILDAQDAPEELFKNLWQSDAGGIFQGESWIQGRHRPVCALGFGGGFCQTAAKDAAGFPIRAVPLGDRGRNIPAGFLGACMGHVCGAERLGRARCGKAVAGFGIGSSAVACSISRPASALVQGCANANLRNNRKQVGRSEADCKKMRMLPSRNAEAATDSLLQRKLRKFWTQRSEIREGWTTRKDGAQVHHVFQAISSLAQRQEQTILFKSLHGTGVSRQEAVAIVAIERVEYKGNVHTLTVGGVHEYTVNGGILVANCDFEDERRHEVFAYMARKYGERNVAFISTFARLGGKSALDDAARSYHIPLNDIDVIKRHLVDRSSGDQRAELTITDTLAEFPEAAEVYERYPALKIVAGCEGRIRHTGKHAAGLIVTSEPIDQYCAVYKAGDERLVAVDWRDSQYLNLMKIDCLGLKELTLYRLMCGKLGMNLDDLYNIPKDDPETFAAFNRHDYLGIFQFTGLATKGVASRIHLESVAQIADVNALARPGPLHSGSTDMYIKGKMKGNFTPILPQLCMDPILSPYYGQLIYQEQIMQILRDVGGLSWADVCAIRALIGKVKGSEAFEDYAPVWKTGCDAKGLSVADATQIWDAIRQFGKYGFNKAHSVSYGFLAYWSMWFKAHHPAHFYWSQLVKAKEDDSVRFIGEALRKGVVFAPISLDMPTASWDIDGDGIIRPGWQVIKGIGPKAAEELAKAAPFASIADLVSRVNKRVVHKGIQKFIEDALGQTVEEMYHLDKWQEIDKLFPHRKSIALVNEGFVWERNMTVVGRVNRINKKNRIEEYKTKGQSTAKLDLTQPAAYDYVILIIEDETDSCMVYVKPEQYQQWKDQIWVCEGSFIAVSGNKLPNIQLISAQDVKFAITSMKEPAPKREFHPTRHTGQGTDV